MCAKDLGVAVYRTASGALIALGAWFGNQVWEGQKEISKNITDIREWRAEMTGSRFTAMDAGRLTISLQEQLAQHDKRITRVEDTLSRVDQTLSRIDSKLKP